MRNGLFAFVIGVSRACGQQLADWPAELVLFDWMLTGAATAAEGARLPAVDGRDQPDNAARVVAAHAGIRANKNTPPHKLRELISKALDDHTLRQGAHHIAAALAESNGAETVADKLEQLAAGTDRLAAN